jgi:DNA-binding transcriptional regulator LsrR (DeoR family)
MRDESYEGASSAPQPGTDGFVHEVAQLAWRNGLTANAIAARLGGPHLIMQVKRALAKAVREGVIVLKPPITDEVSKKLRDQPRFKALEYAVVRNEHFDDLHAICAVASEIIGEKIAAILKKRPAGAEIIIANAGGRAMSEAVRQLHKNPPVIGPYDGNRLTFLALNSAGRRRHYDQSSNFLAVRLAEIFGGKHVAILDHSDPTADKEYAHKVKNIDFLLCGAGGIDSLLIEHAREENVPVPDEVVGDLAFIPLDRDGRPVKTPELDRVLSKLSPHPDYAEILRIARDGAKAVLVVFAEHGSKLDIAKAVLTAGLVTHCVLGLSLANRLLDPSDQDAVKTGRAPASGRRHGTETS